MLNTHIPEPDRIVVYGVENFGSACHYRPSGQPFALRHADRPIIGLRVREPLLYCDRWTWAIEVTVAVGPEGETIELMLADGEQPIEFRRTPMHVNAFLRHTSNEQLRIMPLTTDADLAALARQVIDDAALDDRVIVGDIEFYLRGRRDGMQITTEYAANLLGVSPKTVWYHADKLGLPQPGTGRALLLSPEDVARIADRVGSRNGRGGRPPKQPTP